MARGCSSSSSQASGRARRPTASAPIIGLDHVVVSTDEPERAAALYGARLGLDMTLDLSRPDWGARLMFFRCGDLVVEIVHRLNESGRRTPTSCGA